jgi:hypothetical protein
MEKRTLMDKLLRILSASRKYYEVNLDYINNIIFIEKISNFFIRLL